MLPVLVPLPFLLFLPPMASPCMGFGRTSLPVSTVVQGVVQLFPGCFTRDQPFSVELQTSAKSLILLTPLTNPWSLLLSGRRFVVWSSYSTKSCSPRLDAGHSFFACGNRCSLSESSKDSSFASSVPRLALLHKLPPCFVALSCLMFRGFLDATLLIPRKRFGR